MCKWKREGRQAALYAQSDPHAPSAKVPSVPGWLRLNPLPPLWRESWFCNHTHVRTAWCTCADVCDVCDECRCCSGATTREAVS